jgi:hypothetical protein
MDADRRGCSPPRTGSPDGGTTLRPEIRPPPWRNSPFLEIAGNLVRRGDITHSLNLAASIETSDDGVSDFVALAGAISEHHAKK